MITARNRLNPSTADDPLDATLRATLEPDAATVDRLVRGALAEPGPRPGLQPWRWAAAAAVLLAAMVWLVARPETPGNAPAPPEVAAVPPAAETEAPVAMPAALRISNEHGPVTVTAPAGSKLVFLTPAGALSDARTAPGDAS